jgi:dsRNA-specific ribonuclease
LVAQAEGDSKKNAGQKAARVVFEQLMERAG